MKRNIIILVTIIGFAYNCDKDEKFTDCYSPYQNLETAYLKDATGCSCSEGIDKDTCVVDKNGIMVALMCEDGVWVSVEDGPCMRVLNE